MKKYLLLLVMCFFIQEGQATCTGRFFNPLTDICWRCIFPLRIAGETVVRGNPDPNKDRQRICFCKRPRIPLPVPGIPVSFWEPARLVDVTRTPYCLVNLGGLRMANTGVRDQGHVVDDEGDGKKRSFYNVHWYTYPIMYILEVLTDFACLEAGSIDVAYLTELDPFWNDDEKSAIINPEAILFGNPIAQAACAADGIAATVHLPIDELFWCSGCQGGMYPFGGTVGDHTGGVQASLLVTSRMMAKLHRELLLHGYYDAKAYCGKYMMPIIKKNQYRTQMSYPIPQTSDCQALGKTEIFLAGGKGISLQGRGLWLPHLEKEGVLSPLNTQKTKGLRTLETFIKETENEERIFKEK